MNELAFGRDDVADHQSKSWSQLCLAALIHKAVTPWRWRMAS